LPKPALHHLVVARNVLGPEVVKFFVSNAPEPTGTETLLLVAFSRSKIERMFEDTKGELRMDHFEVRYWKSIQRHLILSCVSHMFLAEFHEEQRGEKSGPDGLAGPHADGRSGADLVPEGPVLADAGGGDQPLVAHDPTTQCPRGPQPPQAYLAAAARPRRVFEERTHVSWAKGVVL
jgi:hypothetical protein